MRGRRAGHEMGGCDPRLSTSGSKADMWIPVIPGKDLQLVCGIMRSLVDRHPE